MREMKMMRRSSTRTSTCTTTTTWTETGTTTAGLFAAAIVVCLLAAGAARAQGITAAERQYMRVLCPRAQTDAQVDQCGRPAVMLACKKLDEETRPVKAKNMKAGDALQDARKLVKDCLYIVTTPGNITQPARKWWQQALEKRNKAVVAWAKAQAEGVEPTYWEKAKADAWDQLKERMWDCGKVMDVFNAFVRYKDAFKGILEPVGSCAAEYVKGFVCAIPDAVHTVFKIIMNTLKAGVGIFQAASLFDPNKFPMKAFVQINENISHEDCKVARQAGKVNGLLCGVGKYFSDVARRLGACMKSLKKDDLIAKVADEMWKGGCELAGGLTLDALIAFFTAGATLPATAARIVAKIASKMPDPNWLAVKASLSGSRAKPKYDRVFNLTTEQGGRKVITGRIEGAVNEVGWQVAKGACQDIL